MLGGFEKSTPPFLMEFVKIRHPNAGWDLLKIEIPLFGGMTQ